MSRIGHCKVHGCACITHESNYNNFGHLATNDLEQEVQDLKRMSKNVYGDLCLRIRNSPLKLVDHSCVVIEKQPTTLKHLLEC